MSYGLPVIIAESSDFVLYSCGNGAAYHLVEIATDDEPGVVVQGDDATQFREEFESFCEAEGVAYALRELWWNYS